MPAGEIVTRDERRRASSADDTPRLSRRITLVVLIALLAATALVLLSHAGSFLILHAPEHSDVIVVLDGEWAQGLRLHNHGYAPRVLLTASTKFTIYSRTEFDLASEFLKSTKPTGMELCRVDAETTFDEAADVQRCLAPLHPRTVLLVASDFDTRRTLEIFRARLPQYHWSIAASSAPYHDADQYWRYRSWAKTVLNAWEQYLYWKLVDMRRANLVLR